MAADPFVELRGEFLREHVDVLDAVAQAMPGQSRVSLLRQILGEWVEREVHRSSVVMRVWHGNGNGPESDRSCTGCSSELARVRSGRGSA